MEKLEEEIKWWKEETIKSLAKGKDELSFVCWGIATGLMMAKGLMKNEPK